MWNFIIHEVVSGFLWPQRSADRTHDNVIQSRSARERGAFQQNQKNDNIGDWVESTCALASCLRIPLPSTAAAATLTNYIT